MKNDKDIKINNKLLNFLIFVLILFLFYQMKDGILNIFSKIFSVLLPILISFTISYALYPIYTSLNKRLNKYVSLTIIYLSITLILVFIIYSLIPNSDLIKDINNIFNYVIKFVSELGTKYNLDIKDLLIKELNNVLNKTIFFITNIFDVIFKITLILILSLYFMLNMEYIKKKINEIFKKYNKLLVDIDNNLTSYFNALIKIIIIQMIEYTIIYFIIGHPYFLLLGVLNSITSIIPIFGTLTTNIIALVTASFISKDLFIITSIMVILLPNIDSYIISPKVYKNKIKMSPIISILAVFIGGSLFGILGILLFIPLTLVVMSIFKYYKQSY